MQRPAAFGVKTVPVVARGGEFVFAQALEDVSRFVGRSSRRERLPPEVLVRGGCTFCAPRSATRCRSRRRGSHERAVQSRDRSIRDLAYHVYQMPDAFLQAVENGVRGPDRRVQRAAAGGRDYARRIAAYGASMADKRRALVESAPRQVLPPDGEDLLRRAPAARAARALHLAFGAARAADHLGARAPRRQAGRRRSRRPTTPACPCPKACGSRQEKAKQALDQVFRDMAGAMAAGMVHVGVQDRPVPRHGRQRGL